MIISLTHKLVQVTTEIKQADGKEHPLWYDKAMAIGMKLILTTEVERKVDYNNPDGRFTVTRKLRAHDKPLGLYGAISDHEGSRFYEILAHAKEVESFDSAILLAGACPLGILQALHEDGTITTENIIAAGHGWLHRQAFKSETKKEDNDQ